MHFYFILFFNQGPTVPLDSGIGDDAQEILVQIKTFLFFLGAIIQLYMYLGILFNKVKMPVEEEENGEDLPTKRELSRFLYGTAPAVTSPSSSSSSRSGTPSKPTFGGKDDEYDDYSVVEMDDVDEFIDNGTNIEESRRLIGENVSSSSTSSSSSSNRNSNRNNSNTNSNSSSNSNGNHSIISQNTEYRIEGDREATVPTQITLAFLENAYIVFWISKDLFWSWGTGDLNSLREIAVAFEVAGMMFGTLSLFIHILNAYVSRKQIVRFIDCITTLCWISANYFWMVGEFFIRYHHLNLDDETQGHDNITRVFASVLFFAGLLLQFGNIIYLAQKDNSNLFKIVFGKICFNWRYNNRNQSYSGINNIQYKRLSTNIEILAVSPQRLADVSDLDRVQNS